MESLFNEILGFILVLIMFVVIFLSLTIKVINQYERGVKFTLGKYVGIMEPGLRIVIPLIQTYKRVDIRQTTVTLGPKRL
jgi:regulator of protease activity HflC (stomatin/prohibitin superfamily)